MKVWQLIMIVLCMALLASCRSTRVRAAASAEARSASAVDPVVTLTPDRAEVGPGETVNWTITTSVPTTETARARQVEVKFIPAAPLRAIAATGPKLLPPTRAELYLEGILFYQTAEYRVRSKGQTDPVLPAADGSSVRIPLGDIDPGGAVPCTVETKWP